MIYSDVVFLFCSFVLSLSYIVYFLSRKKIQKSQSKLFLALLICLVVSSGADVISNHIENSTVATGALFAVQYYTQIIFFLAHTALSVVFVLYVMMVNGSGIQRRKSFMALFLLPFMIVEVLFLINPFTDLMFTYDANADYVRGSWMYGVYLMGAFYIGTSMYYMIRYRKAITRKTNQVLWYFFGFTLAGIIIQMIWSEMKVELFFETVSTLGVMLTIENEDDLIDPTTKIYNRRAFINDNIMLTETDHRYAVITLSITNMRLYTRMLKYSSMSRALKMIVDWLKTLTDGGTIYRLTTSSFAILYLYKDRKEVDSLVERIMKRFSEGWHFQNKYEEYEINFNLWVKLAFVPDEISDPVTLLDMAEEADNMQLSGNRISRGEDLQYLRRRAVVEDAIKRGLKEGGFEVYYQPIWNVETKSITSAEALLRLRDPEAGFIPPAEFIPVAEKSGLISDLGEFVFEKVCEFLSRERTIASGIRYIEVNLSIYQLISGDTADKFKTIMDRYGIKAEQINLEITETASLNAASSVLSNINELKKIGFNFSLDDYGTGYSNLSQIVSMDFMNIKSDKGLLWDSDGNRNSKLLLADTIKMMRSLGMNVIQEGVETRDQLDFVIDAGSNLIQGYYFSKPVDAESFLDYVEGYKDHTETGSV